MAVNSEGKTVLGLGNFVQVGTLVSIVVGVAGGAVWVTRLDGRLSNLEADVREIRERNDGYLSDDAFDLWVDLLEARNPSLVIPKLGRAR